MTMVNINKVRHSKIHSKLDFQLRRNETVYQTAIRNWFNVMSKQVKKDLNTKVKKDLTSELTNWSFLEEQGKQILKPATLKIMQSGGQQAFNMLSVKGSFDVVNLNAVKAAERHTAQLVKEVTAETKKGIRTAIKAGVAEGKGMPKVAKGIRPLVGLTQNQTQSVLNYKKLLGDKDKFPNLTTGDIDKKVQRYADKTHIRRAKTIARTETARAQNLGYTEGLAEIGVVKAEFEVHEDERLCPICESLDGEKYNIVEAKSIIPVHPNCRCAMLPVVGDKTFKGDISDALGSELPINMSTADGVMPWRGYLTAHRGGEKNTSAVLYDWYKLKYQATEKLPPSAIKHLKQNYKRFEVNSVKIKIPIPGVTTPGIPPKPPTGLPDSIKGLVERWKAAKSRSSKWVYGNKLKQLGYDVRTGIYKPTGIGLPKTKLPKPKPDVKPKPTPKKPKVPTTEKLPKEVDMKGAHESFKGTAEKEVTQLKADYPKAFKEIKSMKMISNSQYKKLMDGGGVGGVIPVKGGYQIIYNSKYLGSKTPVSAKEILKAMNKKKWLVGNKVEHLVTHEFGHIVLRSSPKGVSNVFNYWLKATPKQVKAMKTSISRYAAQSAEELFAESFVQYRMGKATPLAKKILRLGGLKI